MGGRVTTDVDFVVGFDPVSPVPEVVRAAGLRHRIAIVQHTDRVDTPDMYFDEELWRSLLQFVLDYDPALQVRIGSEDTTPSAFLSEWSRLSHREPPELVVAKDNGTLVLCAATEYWTRVGGPAPYADSYTYSVFSRDDITSRLTKWLREANVADQWKLSDRVTPAGTQLRKY